MGIDHDTGDFTAKTIYSVIYQEERNQTLVSWKSLYLIPKGGAVGGNSAYTEAWKKSWDTSGFVDEYMRVKPDGHIKFYSFAEL